MDKWLKYEAEKAKLKHLSPEEYERAIKRLAEKLGL